MRAAIDLDRMRLTLRELRFVNITRWNLGIEAKTADGIDFGIMRYLVFVADDQRLRIPKECYMRLKAAADVVESNLGRGRFFIGRMERRRLLAAFQKKSDNDISNATTLACTDELGAGRSVNR